MKTPLAAIRGAAELVLDSGETMTSAERRRFMQNIVADVERMTQLLERLHEQARAETPGQTGAATLGVLLAALGARFPELQLVFSGDVETAIALNEENALVVLGHLASNARDHGATSLHLAATTMPEACLLSAQDNGAGVTPGNRGRIFDPFFTTRRENGGTGMGLTIARSMLEAHGGSIEAVDCASGARFDLRLPLASQGLHKKS
jgi:signal transduction histidine kinase